MAEIFVFAFSTTINTVEVRRNIVASESYDKVSELLLSACEILNDKNMLKQVGLLTDQIVKNKYNFYNFCKNATLSKEYDKYSECMKLLAFKVFYKNCLLAEQSASDMCFLIDILDEV